MKSTKDRILQTLLRKPRITINEIAEAVGINAISVRHHLSNLEKEGLIAAEEERHGVGRPRLVYSLTEEGMERFPTKYLRLTTRLLAQLKETMPGPIVTQLFNQVAEDLANQYAADIRGLSMEERLDFVKELLAQEGFTVEWELKDGQYQIHEISCPYYQIGISHPEVCTMDQTLISKMLAVPASKVQCILSGGSHCTYVVQPVAAKN
ncbi:MAG: helix-turn-helix transcriptional regulator [Chloroflexota bacterium]|nr:winged helix-turn-helix transcriptional regulator [Chloroflexota bacterium]MBI5703944.1 winged helix-turn-helix transcriptional regulator [Chloroflexota bacterium]